MVHLGIIADFERYVLEWDRTILSIKETVCRTVKPYFADCKIKRHQCILWIQLPTGKQLKLFSRYWTVPIQVEIFISLRPDPLS